MNQSYVGITSVRGLESIHVENADVVRFLQRRAHRKRPYATVFWAILSEQAIEFIEYQLAIGDCLGAFWTMQTEAIYGGAILPTHTLSA